MTPLVALLISIAAVLQLFVVGYSAYDYLNTGNSAITSILSLIVWIVGVILFTLSIMP